MESDLDLKFRINSHDERGDHIFRLIFEPLGADSV